MSNENQAVVIGAGGFIGRALVGRLAGSGVAVTAVDRYPPSVETDTRTLDLLRDDIDLPPGTAFVVAGSSQPRPRRPWTTVLDNAITTARLAPHLDDRDVVLLSSIEVYGTAPGPLREDAPWSLPISEADLDKWCDQALLRATQECPPWHVQDLCERLLSFDPSGRWLYGIAKAAQERMIERCVPEDRLTTLRSANIFGAGQQRVLGRFVHGARFGAPLTVSRGVERTFVSMNRVLDALTADLPAGTYNLGEQAVTLEELTDIVFDTVGSRTETRVVNPPTVDSCGVVDGSKLAAILGADPPIHDQLRTEIRQFVTDDQPLFSPALQVVIPPRPEATTTVINRQQEALWSGVVKHGGPWTTRLEATLAQRLGLTSRHRLVLTNSGTTALRLAALAVVDEIKPGDIAVVPSFTFAATAEVLLQLGFDVRFCDIDPSTWTLDPAALDDLLTTVDARLVVAVDALGNPAHYETLDEVCRRHGVALIADSAPALGSSFQGSAVGTQTKAHSFSMSFAKTITAGGAGGAVVLPVDASFDEAANWLRSSTMHELHAVAALDLVDVLDDIVARRCAVARIYDALVERRPELSNQTVRSGDVHCYVHYAIRVADDAIIGGRDALADGLSSLGVETKPYYFPPLHLGVWAQGRSDHLPITEQLARQTLAIPMSSEMTTEEADRVVMAIDRVLGRPAANGLASR